MIDSYLWIWDVCNNELRSARLVYDVFGYLIGGFVLGVSGVLGLDMVLLSLWILTRLGIWD